MELGSTIDDLWMHAKGMNPSRSLPEVALDVITFINSVELTTIEGKVLPWNQFSFYIDDLRKHVASIP